jgi:hypothetical protein
MKDRFLAARPSEEFRIYLVVRDLLDLMPSSYAQKVRYGFNNFDFDTFFSERMAMRRVNYFETARRWAKAFGWPSIQVRILDPAHLVNGDLIDDFLDVCGVNDNEARASLTRTGMQNVAPGWRVLEATRALHNDLHGLPATHPLPALIKKQIGSKTFARMAGKCATNAGETRGWNRDRGQYLTREQAQLCYEIYRDTVLRLNKKLTRKLPLPRELVARGFAERNFLPDISHISRQELRGYYDDLWELLRKKRNKTE